VARSLVVAKSSTTSYHPAADLAPARSREISGPTGCPTATRKAEPGDQYQGASHPSSAEECYVRVMLKFVPDPGTAEWRARVYDPHVVPKRSQNDPQPKSTGQSRGMATCKFDPGKDLLATCKYAPSSSLLPESKIHNETCKSCGYHLALHMKGHVLPSMAYHWGMSDGVENGMPKISLNGW